MHIRQIYRHRYKLAFPGGASDKEPACQCKRHKRHRFDPWVRKTSWRRAWQPFQDSCLENRMDRGTWQASVHRIAKSWTQLKWLSVHMDIDMDIRDGCIHSWLSVHMNIDMDIWRWMYIHTHISLLLLFSCSVVSNSLQPYCYAPLWESALDKNHLIAFLTSGSAFGTVVILYLYSMITSCIFQSFVTIKFSYFNKRTYKIFNNYNGVPRLLNWTAFAWRV